MRCVPEVKLLLLALAFDARDVVGERFLFGNKSVGGCNELRQAVLLVLDNLQKLMKNMAMSREFLTHSNFQIKSTTVVYAHPDKIVLFRLEILQRAADRAAETSGAVAGRCDGDGSRGRRAHIRRNQTEVAARTWFFGTRCVFWDVGMRLVIWNNDLK